MQVKLRPMLSTEDQIKHLQSKGVTFDKMSIEEATRYLDENNNYFKLRAYRKNFPKFSEGERAGQYINLDFAMLKDLSVIDKRLRYILVQLALDVEHFAKVKLLKYIELHDEDGYDVVSGYISHLIDLDLENQTNYHGNLMIEINRNRNNPYCGGIIDKYDPRYPVWAFVEIIPLGTFLHFYSYCAKTYYKCKDLENDYYLLKTVKQIRNAAAHSNCILHDMGAYDGTVKVNNGINQALNSLPKKVRRRQLGNVRMLQIVTLLYYHSRLVTSTGIRLYTKKTMKDFSERLMKHIDYYRGNQTICASFDFLKKTIDILFN